VTGRDKELNCRKMVATLKAMNIGTAHTDIVEAWKQKKIREPGSLTLIPDDKRPPIRGQ
jgi:hypothetical protein